MLPISPQPFPSGKRLSFFVFTVFFFAFGLAGILIWLLVDLGNESEV